MTAKEKLTALADAVREKTGETSPLSLDRMTALISALEVGGLPNGWDMGIIPFDTESKKGGFSVEHRLGSVPNIVIIFCCGTESEPLSVTLVSRVNYDDEYVEEEGLYYPLTSAGRMFYYNMAGTNIVQMPDSGTGMDTDKSLYVPESSTAFYNSASSYRWLAIRI